jgi:hypothetical protein
MSQVEESVGIVSKVKGWFSDTFAGPHGAVNVKLVRNTAIFLGSIVAIKKYGHTLNEAMPAAPN